MADKKEGKKETKAKKSRTMWIQYEDKDILTADVLQVASDEEEAKGLDPYFQGCPWFIYTVVIGHDGRYLETDTKKPIYFID